MRTVRLVYAAFLLAGSTAMYAAEPAAGQFTLSEQTKVPGITLKPGTYSIRVVDHLADRLIVRVDGTEGDTHATFLGIQNSAISKPSGGGPVVWAKSPKGGTVLRGFEFPGGGSVVEFVYPKDDAVSIAKLNEAKVPAIDPASEGKVADKSLSKDDLEVVTLWLLSSTTVGPNDSKPAIQAERYQAPPSEQTVIASAAQPTSVDSSIQPRTDQNVSTPQVAAVHKPKPVIAKLPHTASAMPLVWLLCGFSFVGAALLRTFRLGGVRTN